MVTQKVIYVFFNLFQMPPKKKARTLQETYTLEDLHQAYLAVTVDGLTIRGVAREYGVPYSTLNDRVKERTVPSGDTIGRQQVFSRIEERRICRHLNQMADWGVRPHPS